MRVADYVMYCRAPEARRTGRAWRNFIFGDRRRAHSEEYSAPSINL
jgi:hypothetical protein